uniref:Uncharacterized protein n=1 Tax=Tanacetum cinerariifolium TaxID=118510 RepID=A0A6L2MAD0_TANCI|nr:hypothetical protein [Tanacetum cinerariifolium]
MKPSTTKKTSKVKALTKSSKTGKSTTAQEPIEEPIAETNNPSRDTWFKQPPRSPNPDPEWNKRQVVTYQPKQPWFNHMVSAAKDPLTFDELMATPIDFSTYAMNRLNLDNLTQEILVGPVYNLLKGTCTSSIELEYNMKECFKILTDRLNWNNPEGDHCPFDLTKPLPLKGHPGHLTVAAKYFFNNDLEFLKSLDPKKRVIYEDLNKQKRVIWANELYKFSDRILKTIRDELHHRIIDFHPGYNKEMSRRKWTAIDKRRSELMVELIDKQMHESDNGNHSRANIKQALQ